MSIEVIHIIDQLCREKGIDKEVLIDAVQSAVEAAARKKMPYLETLESKFNMETGEVEIFTEKTVVVDVEDPAIEISLKEAEKAVSEVQLGETVLAQQELGDLGRIAAQLAKQVILQKVREAEIEIVYKDFQDKKGDIINGFVQRFEHGDIIVDLGKAEGILPRREQVFRETFNRGERIRAYVLDIRKTPKNTLAILSRTHVGLIKSLFELEVPEISEGMVEIMGIVREPSGRTKIAVRSNDRDIDAVGACVGMRGMRVQAIVQELRGEKIDIVEYSEDPEMFIRNALSPAKVSRIFSNKEENHMSIIVADDQMSLAIGKKGQNVRLAAKLVKWKIDIKSETEAPSLMGAPESLLGSGSSGEDFLEIMKNTKGFGEKIINILFTNNIVNFDEVIKRGLEGLLEVAGIGPKKAEALLEFAQSQIALRPPKPKAPEPRTGQEDTLTYRAPLAGEKVAAETDAPDVETEEDPSAEETVETAQEEDQEDQELGLDVLVDIDPKVIGLLEKNGFQTIAELSVTAADELTVIEGIDEALAKNLIDQAKQLIEKFENA